MTNRSNIKRDNSKSLNNQKNNEIAFSPDSLDVIMQDVLALLNIQVSYKERISQINNLMKNKDKNYSELNLTVMSSTLKYEKNSYIITPYGLNNSKRNSKDGIVLFGYEKKNIIYLVK